MFFDQLVLPPGGPAQIRQWRAADESGSSHCAPPPLDVSSAQDDDDVGRRRTDKVSPVGPGDLVDLDVGSRSDELAELRVAVLPRIAARVTLAEIRPDLGKIRPACWIGWIARPEQFLLPAC